MALNGREPLRAYFDIEIQWPTATDEAVVRDNLNTYLPERQDLVEATCDIALRDTPFTAELAADILRDILEMLIASLAKRLHLSRAALMGGMDVLTASTAKKLSFHVITPVVVNSAHGVTERTYRSCKGRWLTLLKDFKIIDHLPSHLKWRSTPFPYYKLMCEIEEGSTGPTGEDTVDLLAKFYNIEDVEPDLEGGDDDAEGEDDSSSDIEEVRPSVSKVKPKPTSTSQTRRPASTAARESAREKKAEKAAQAEANNDMLSEAVRSLGGRENAAQSAHRLKQEELDLVAGDGPMAVPIFELVLQKLAPPPSPVNTFPSYEHRQPLPQPYQPQSPFPHRSSSSTASVIRVPATPLREASLQSFSPMDNSDFDVVGKDYRHFHAEGANDHSFVTPDAYRQ
ncbi:hypothetical protein B9479_003233 [Cryptococcus floricola]|uniref:Uncharacterized protein n=1 Tax=Cryptococcus floricola TaxID=2591691 RepID=A0A5D3B1I0_9TREE|nr:hypothetical protein B9479_003233 [Cryptococcus floricola]